jgi:ABC-type lipoprotein release transport system permease subunit
MAYVPMSQSGYDGGTLIARSTTPAGAVAREARALVAALPTNPEVSGSSTIAELWGQTLTRPRARMDGMLLVTLLTLGLGIQGIFVSGMWMVQVRRRELAVRLTLGANPGHLAVLVLSRVALPASAGAVAGGVAIPLLAPMFAHWLGETASMQVAPMAAAIGLLLLAVFVGTLVPARSIALIDPLETMRRA